MESITGVDSILAFLHANSYCFYWLLAFLIGCISALAELLSRYSGGFKVLTFRESYLYFAINGFASLFAYWFLLSYKIDLGPLTKSDIGKVLTSGLSSMVILRSSFACIKYGDKTWDAGFAPILQIFLNTADRAFDQSRSKLIIQEVGQIMKDVDFYKAQKSLPLLCFSAMQNLSKDELEKAAAEIKTIGDESYMTEVKALHLGIILERYTGITLLEAIVAEFQKASAHKSVDKDQGQEDSLRAQQAKIKAMKDKFLSLQAEDKE